MYNESVYVKNGMFVNVISCCIIGGFFISWYC